MTFPSSLSGQKVFVTGANGFIGSHLCQHLCRGGAEVHGLYRAKHSCTEYDLCWWQGDLADLQVVHRLLTAIKPDVICHLASHVAGARDLELVIPTFRSNLMSTVNLLTVASDIGCRRIVLTGSLEEPDVTDAQAVPSSPYAAAKWASSAYSRMFHTLYQLPVVILRVFMVYGPAQQDIRKLIPYVILSLLRGEEPQLTGGQRQVDWVYVDDVVEAFLSAMHAPNIDGQTLDVGSGELVSIRTVVEHLVRLTNPKVEPCFGTLSDRPLEQVRVADTVRTQDVIGWQPATPLEEGLKRTIAWYAQRH